MGNDEYRAVRVAPARQLNQTQPISCLARTTESGGTGLPGRRGPAELAFSGHAYCHLEPACDNRQRQGCGTCLRQAVAIAQRAGLADGLELAREHRRQFWMDTCREVKEMRISSRHVLELYRQHGCLFDVAAPQQVQSILDALDAALPSWDREHPELFYQTLGLNFPHLVRRSRAPRRA